MLATLDANARSRIEADTAALANLQRETGDGAVLPRIVPQEVSPYAAQWRQAPPARMASTRTDIPWDGIAYAAFQYDVSTLLEQGWPRLALYANLRHDLGVSEMDYQEVLNNSMQRLCRPSQPL